MTEPRLWIVRFAGSPGSLPIYAGMQLGDYVQRPDYARKFVDRAEAERWLALFGSQFGGRPAEVIPYVSEPSA